MSSLSNFSTCKYWKLRTRNPTNKLTSWLTFKHKEMNHEIVEKPWKPRQIREIKKSKKKWKKGFDVKNNFLSTLWKDEIKNILIKVKVEFVERLPKQKAGIN